MKTILIPIAPKRGNRATYINPALIESLVQTDPRTVTITMASGAPYEIESDDVRRFGDFLKGAERALTIAASTDS